MTHLKKIIKCLNGASVQNKCSWLIFSPQILFLTGLTLIIGFRKTSHFFFQRHKFRGSFFFLGGVSLVLCRWPMIGMLAECYGFILLFRLNAELRFCVWMCTWQLEKKNDISIWLSLRRSFFPTALGLVQSLVNLPFLNNVRMFSRSLNTQLPSFANP